VVVSKGIKHSGCAGNICKKGEDMNRYDTETYCPKCGKMVRTSMQDPCPHCGYNGEDLEIKVNFICNDAFKEWHERNVLGETIKHWPDV